MAKTKDVIINFKGTDPVASTGRYDKVPEGTYHVKVKKAEVTQTSTDKPAISANISITKGPLTGKTVRDIFVLPRKGEKGDSKFGQQRLLGAAMACGIKQMAGKVTAKSVAKALEGRGCICEIADSTMPASGSYSEKVTSAPQAYYATKSKEGKAALKEFEARSSDDEEEEEEDEDEEDEDTDTDDEDDDDDDDEGDDDDDDDDGDEDEDVEEEEKPKKKRSKKAKPKKSKKDDEEELYDDDEDDDEEDDEDDD